MDATENVGKLLNLKLLKLNCFTKKSPGGGGEGRETMTAAGRERRFVLSLNQCKWGCSLISWECMTFLIRLRVLVSVGNFENRLMKLWEWLGKTKTQGSETWALKMVWPLTNSTSVPTPGNHCCAFCLFLSDYFRFHIYMISCRFSFSVSAYFT